MTRTIPWRNLESLIGFLGIAILAVFFSPTAADGSRIFLQLGNLTDILRQVSVIGIIALAMTFVILTAGIDLTTGIVSWTFRSLDPVTHELPPGVDDGFLPIDDATGRGIGTVSYQVQPHAGLASGTIIPNHANIVFDTNDPISTPTFTNTIDSGAPTSHVNTLPTISPATCEMSASSRAPTSLAISLKLLKSHSRGYAVPPVTIIFGRSLRARSRTWSKSMT